MADLSEKAARLARQLRRIGAYTYIAEPHRQAINEAADHIESTPIDEARARAIRECAQWLVDNMNAVGRHNVRGVAASMEAELTGQVLGLLRASRES